MRHLRWALALAAMAVAPTSLAAQVGNFKFLSGSNVTAFNVRVGTYKGQLDGRTIDVWCVDFLNNVRVNDRYQVNISGLGGPSPDLSRTRFGSLSNARDRYRQAAWLATQFGQVPATSASWGSLHAAIWQLMTPGKPAVSTAMQPNVSHWLTQAAANYKNYYYRNVYVLSDVAIARCAAANPAGAPWTGCGKQEHIMIEGGQLTVTPEPATVGLVATGLVGLGGAAAVRRRRQRAGDQAGR